MFQKIRLKDQFTQTWSAEELFSSGKRTNYVISKTHFIPEKHFLLTPPNLRKSITRCRYRNSKLVVLGSFSGILRSRRICTFCNNPYPWRIPLSLWMYALWGKKSCHRGPSPFKMKESRSSGNHNLNALTRYIFKWIMMALPQACYVLRTMFYTPDFLCATGLRINCLVTLVARHNFERV